MSFDSQLYNDYYNDFFLNQKIISVQDIKTSREYYVFTGEERTGDPHWLGNDYIFFTTYCGTSCQGIYLIDTRNKESELGVTSYLFEGERWVTHFRDWFGGEFVFEGLLNEVKSEISGAGPVLIFDMTDDKRNFLGEKKLLFTGNSLKLI